MLSRTTAAVGLGLAVAAAPIVVGLVRPRLEETVGLGLLFWLRGPREPPPEVVVVAIDEPAADRLQLPRNPAKWPRSVHARLTDTLKSARATVIAFDVTFLQPQTKEDDDRFASALGNARNVILAQYCERGVPAKGSGSDDASGSAIVETLLSPIPALAEAAAGLAPHPLSKAPPQVTQQWVFKRGAGDAPTLPAVALQLYAAPAYPHLASLMRAVRPALADTVPSDGAAPVRATDLDLLVRRLRQIFLHDPLLKRDLLERLDADRTVTLDEGTRRLVVALIGLYGGEDTRYLNFYGPPRTIPTISYDRALLGAGPDHGDSEPTPELQGRMVFVGVSAVAPTNQRDGFFTAFSRPDGLDLSGVEIAATAFANMLERSSPERARGSALLAMILVPGFFLGVLCAILPTSLAAVAAVTLAALWVAIAAHTFGTSAYWLPVTPVLLQAPLAFVAGVVQRQARAVAERRTIRRALAYYLPAPLVDQLFQELPTSETRSEVVYGICLFTDAEGYTSLAETLEPAELATVMNSYFAAMFDPIKRRGGILSTVAADSVLAIWPVRGDSQAARGQACLAALEIAEAVDHFNRQRAGRGLPTRIGLHSGQLRLGNLGAGDRYEYRALGDIVNSASRLEGLNKLLGTRTLASHEVTRDLAVVAARDLGRFLMVGKSTPIAVRQLMCRAEELTARQLALTALFDEALRACHERQWKEAGMLFQRCVDDFDGDGPSRFYLRLCTQYGNDGVPEDWDGIVRVESK